MDLVNVARRSRHVLFSRAIWNRRLWFVGGAAVVGLAAIAFALAASWANHVFLRLVAWSAWAPLVVTPLGFALIAWATRTFFPGSQGSGIPQTIAALSSGDAVRRKLLSVRVAVGKVLLTVVGLLAGASIGREGPSVQVGASIMHALSRSSFFPYERMQRGLILAGGAAGVAGAFNAPLAGVVFAIEEMSRSFEHRTISIVVMAVIVSGVLSLAFLGDYAYFGHTAATIDLAQGWKAVVLCGVLGGLFGGLFSRLLIGISTALPAPLAAWRGARPISFAAGCGLLLAVLGFVSGGLAYGTGYDEARDILAGGETAQSFGIVKMVATLVSYASGIPGGIFAPSLAAGAGLGQNLQLILPTVPVAALAVLGMAGYFAGVVQAPLTAFIIVLEMTKDPGMGLPLMACASIAFAVSRILCPRPLYKALARPFKHGNV